MANKRGVAGLQILLSVVILVFVIGLVIFLFSLMSGELSNATEIPYNSDVINESVYFTNGTGTELSVSSLNDVSVSNVEVRGCYTE